MRFGGADVKTSRGRLPRSARPQTSRLLELQPSCAAIIMLSLLVPWPAFHPQAASHHPHIEHPHALRVHTQHHRAHIQHVAMQEPWSRTQAEIDAEAAAKAAWLARRASDEAEQTKILKPYSQVTIGGVDLLESFRARISELPSAPPGEKTKRRLPNEGRDAPRQRSRWDDNGPCWEEGALDALGTLAMSDPPRFVHVKLCFEGVRKSISVPIGATTDELFDAAADLHGLEDQPLELAWSSGVPLRRGVHVSTTRLACAAKGEDVFVRALELPRRPRAMAPRALGNLAKRLGYRLVPIGHDEGSTVQSPSSLAVTVSAAVAAPLSAAVAAPVAVEAPAVATASAEDAAKAAWFARQGVPSWGPQAAAAAGAASSEGSAAVAVAVAPAAVTVALAPAAGGASHSDEITLTATRAVERAAEAAVAAAQAAQAAADAARIAAEAAQLALASRAPVSHL